MDPRPVITSMRCYTGSRRTEPKSGDVRTTKKHGVQIRVPVVHDGRWVVSGGRQCYEWKFPDEVQGTGFAYLLSRPSVAAALAEKAST